MSEHMIKISVDCIDTVGALWLRNIESVVLDLSGERATKSFSLSSASRVCLDRLIECANGLKEEGGGLPGRGNSSGYGSRLVDISVQIAAPLVEILLNARGLSILDAAQSLELDQVVTV